MNKGILWKDNVLYLSDIPLLKVFDKLEYWYKVTFQYSEEPSLESLVTGVFENKSLKAVLKSVSYAVSFNYEINGNKVNVQFK